MHTQPVTIPLPGATKERREDFFQLISRHARPLILNPDQTAIVSFSSNGQRNRAADRRKPQRIAQHVFYCPMEQFAIGAYPKIRQLFAVDRNTSACRLKSGILDQITDQLSQVHILKRHTDPSLKTGKREQLTNQPIHPRAFTLDALQAVLHPCRLLARQPNCGVQAGEW